MIFTRRSVFVPATLLVLALQLCFPLHARADIITATTLLASNVTGTNATLNGAVSSNGLPTTAYFQYGVTAGYGSFSSTQNVSFADSALSFNGINQYASLFRGEPANWFYSPHY